MRIFVTGATGFIGSAVVKELIDSGHHVLGLARSDEAAASLTAAGAEVQRGSMDDLESLRQGAVACDGVIHTAFNHDFSKFAENCETEKRAVETLGAAYAGSQRPLVVTSGTALVSPGHMATEDMRVHAGPDSFPRVVLEITVDRIAEQGVRVMVVRCSPSVHGEGDHGFVPRLIGIARESGVSAYVSDGFNRWPGVHRLDVAALFRLALEKGTPGARYHGAADEGVPFREIAGVIGRRLNVPMGAKSPEEALAHFGFLGHFASLDCPASSQWTRAQLGWKPKQLGLIADLDHPYYFEPAVRA